MQIIVANTIRVIEPTAAILQWAKQELEIPNPEYAKKQRMGFWTGNTPKTISLYERDGMDLVLPFGVLDDLLTRFPTVVYYQLHEADCGILYPFVPLYAYQRTAVTECILKDFGILCAPAGSGKTRMGLALISSYQKRALWLTHTADLLNQSKRAAAEFFPEDIMGTITEGKVNIGSGITFATIQTMCNIDLSRYKDYWDIVIVDECHRVCGTPTNVTMFYKVLSNLNTLHKYGLSATVHRADGLEKAMFALIGNVAYTVPEEAVADKIMRVNIAPKFTEFSLNEKCLNTDGTINYTRTIEQLVTDRDRNVLIATDIMCEAECPSIVLSTRLKHLQTLMDLLPDYVREKAVMIDGTMTSKRGKEERIHAIEQMRSGEKNILFATYNLCKEGLDIPRLERLYMAVPQKDYAVIVQSIGRIARTYPGKAEPVCVDYIDRGRFFDKWFRQRCTSYRKAGAYILDKR